MIALDQKSVLILGLGESGVALSRWCLAQGARVRVADSRSAPPGLAVIAELLPETSIHCGGFPVALLEGIDIVAVSPGLALTQAPQAVLLAEAARRQLPVWGELEFFAQKIAQLRVETGYAPRMIGITGTNGKTTVTSLTAKLCQRSGISVIAAGNISPSAMAALADAIEHDALPDIWVLELSSFQLATTDTLTLDAAAVLNVSQDHLDWHDTMAAYVAAKARIYARAGVAVVNRDDPQVVSMVGSGAATDVITFGLDAPAAPNSLGILQDGGMRWLAFAEPVEAESVPNKRQRRLLEQPVVIKRLMPQDALRIRGNHNAANALAALGLCRAIGMPMAPLLHALRDYRGEPHRVEHVMTVDGIDYVDDSKGTNVGATVAALEGLGRRVVLIAGGDGKGQDFAPLGRAIVSHVRALVLIGKDAAAIAQAVAAAGGRSDLPVISVATLHAAVVEATRLAQAGDVVLLSPACASLDMFKSYRHRAEVFVDAVREMVMETGQPC